MADEYEEAPVGIVDETPEDQSVDSGDEFAAEMWPDASDDDSDGSTDSPDSPAPSDAPFDPSSVNAARTTEGDCRRRLTNATKPMKNSRTTPHDRQHRSNRLRLPKCKTIHMLLVETRIRS